MRWYPGRRDPCRQYGPSVCWSSQRRSHGSSSSRARHSLRHPSPKTPGTGGSSLSLEKLDTLDDTDLLLVTYLLPPAQAQLEGNALFKQIPAVKDGRFVSMWMQLEYNFNLF